MQAKRVIGVVICILAWTNISAQPATGRNPEPESGVVELRFDDAATAYGKVTFARKYKSPPLVITSECYSKGSWLISKAEDVGSRGCTIGAIVHGGERISYTGHVAYLVIARD